MAADESGYTLIELLIALLVIGALLAIAVPSYLSFAETADVATAKSNLRAALPAVESYRHDHETYDATTMTVEELREYDGGLADGLAVVSGSKTTYCLRSTHGTATVFKNGPDAPIAAAVCS